MEDVTKMDGKSVRGRERALPKYYDNQYQIVLTSTFHYHISLSSLSSWTNTEEKKRQWSEKKGITSSLRALQRMRMWANIYWSK